MKSDYQLFKLAWLSILPLTKDAIHVYIGVLCLLVALLLFRRKLSSLWALVPGLVLSLVMEYFDLRDGFGWQASAHDLINTNLIPALLVILARLELIHT